MLHVPHIVSASDLINTVTALTGFEFSDVVLINLNVSLNKMSR